MYLNVILESIDEAIKWLWANVQYINCSL